MNGKNTTYIQAYADDMILVSPTEMDLKYTIEILRRCLLTLGLHINPEKSEIIDFSLNR